MKDFQIIAGDNLPALRGLADCSVDAIVTDPPYGLSFMGKKWDYDVPGEDVWRECLRVLKPGGHLMAFAGTRTQHRMAIRIEDAGFEIRDMIAWVYGSGFPKSLDVSKAIDRAAGAERKPSEGGATTCPDFPEPCTGHASANGSLGGGVMRHALPTAPATEAAREWDGWGTALKPALETVTLASKPYTDKQERDIILSNLIRLEARLWLLSSVSAAEKSSTSSQNEYGAACVIAQWSAEEITSTQAALCGQMDMSLFELATTTSLSIVSSWRDTLAESWSDGSTSTTETKSSTTIDLRTLKFSLSQITPASIIKACSLPGGFSANASTAESHFNASLLLLQSIRTLSATERAISQAQHERLGAGVKPNLDPCILARKPLSGTVAANVLAYGTGALNVDGCRIPNGSEQPKGSGARGSWRAMEGRTDLQPHGGNVTPESGRFPANLIHDGSNEVVGLFPQAGGGFGKRGGRDGATVGDYGMGATMETVGYGDFGSAARFFYCAKASRSEREAGLEENKCTHPTVKPVALMRYLCRLVTPPGGIVLDPFMGSGSTGCAAILEGFRFIGMEREAEYIAIAQARIEHAIEHNNAPASLLVAMMIL